MTDFVLNVSMIRTLIGFYGIGISFYLLYRYVFPKLHPFSMAGALIRYGATCSVTMLFLSLLFLSKSMRWTLNPSDWMWNFIFARAIDNPFAAHVFSYISVPLIYFGAFWLTRNEFFSFSYAASSVFIHEMVWFGFTSYFALSQSIYWPTLITSTAFAFMICMFGLVIIHIYKVKWKVVLWPLLYTIAFDIVWFWWNGWHISVTIFDVMGRAQYAATQYYWDAGANLFENVGWLTLVPVMLLVLYYAKPNVERLFGREFKELPKHGWLK